MASFLKIGCWNVNGLSNKINEYDFTEAIKGFDLICLQETKCCQDQVISLEGYQLHNVNRPQEQNYPPSGGLMILYNTEVSRGISFLKNTNSEFQWLKLSKTFFTFENDLYICFAYIAPEHSSYVVRHNLEVLTQLEADISTYSTQGDIMIMGDTNSRTSTKNELLDFNTTYLPAPAFSGNSGIIPERQSKDSVLNTRGRELLDLCSKANLIILNGRTLGDSSGKPTCFQYNGNSVVDYCIVSDKIYENILYFQVENHIPHVSDHAKIVVKLHAKFEDKVNNSNILYDMPGSWHWKESSYFDFQLACMSNDVKGLINNFKSVTFNSIDEMTESLGNIIYNICDKSLKKQTPNRKKKKKLHHKKWFDNELHVMRKELLRRSRRYANDPYNTTLRGSFFRYRKIYKKCCKKQYKLFKETLINKLESLHKNDPNEYWKLVKELKEESQVEDPSNKISSEDWVKHFAVLFTVKPVFKEQDQKFKHLLTILEKNTTFSELDFSITESELTKAISSLKNKKSAGLDAITNEMLKAGQEALKPCLLKLFNNILLSGQYPSSWKVSYIKPLFKGGDANDPNNYRGISVMPCMAKLFNSILNNRLQKFIDNGFISDAQIGFQPQSRTSDHMFVVRTLLDKYFSKGSKLYACFIDFAKAFDTVMHSILLYKLCSIGISGPFYHVLKNMYKDNYAHIRIKQMLSPTVSPEIGVRQGDNLSPNLFKIFINDLPSIFDSSDDQVTLGDMNFSCLLYADDLLLLSTSPNGLQQCIRKLESYCDNNGLIVNLKKTNVITFCKNGRLSNEKYFYKDHELQHVSSYKYLGVIFTSSGTFSHGQKDLCSRATKASFKLSRIFGQLHQRIDTMLHLFDHTVKPILLYGSEIWGTVNISSSILKKSNYNILKSYNNMPSEKQHLKFLKYVLSVHKRTSNEAVYGELGRYPLFIEIICTTVKYYHRLLTGKVSKLLLSSFQESELLCDKNKNSWVASVNHVFKTLNIPNTSWNKKDIHIQVRHRLVNLFKSTWRYNIVETRGKLRTYSQFKNNLHKEPYLNILKDRNIRVLYTRIRVSAHKLRIETGRYKNTPADLRFCTLCKTDQVEDELHFAMTCQSYNVERETLFEEINKLNPNFVNLPNKQKFIWLMSSEHSDFIVPFATFLYKAYNKRAALLISK